VAEHGADQREFAETGGVPRYGMPTDLRLQEITACPRGTPSWGCCLYGISAFANDAMSISGATCCHKPYMVSGRILEGWEWETFANGDHLGARIGRPYYNYTREWWQQDFEHGHVDEFNMVCYTAGGVGNCYYAPRLPWFGRHASALSRGGADRTVNSLTGLAHRLRRFAARRGHGLSTARSVRPPGAAPIPMDKSGAETMPTGE
jgi:hypothetical protein